MSREGLRIAALDRARRAQALLGDGVVVLMGVPLVVLHGAPQRQGSPPPQPAANADVAPAASPREPARAPLR